MTPASTSIPLLTDRPERGQINPAIFSGISSDSPVLTVFLDCGAIIVLSIEDKSNPASLMLDFFGIFAQSSIFITLTMYSLLDLYGEKIFILFLYQIGSAIINETNAVAINAPNAANNAINSVILSLFILHHTFHQHMPTLALL